METPLLAEDLEPDPLVQFQAWFAAASGAGLATPEAMTLATADSDGAPSARIVLLKRVDRGFVFYTNYGSRKGRELEANPRAALVLHWQPLGRQVRVEGDVERVSEEESARYFATRPRGGQIGAWASAQSSPLESSEALRTRVAELATHYEGASVPLPPFWGGYRLVPDRIEFWQHGEDRLHDRLAYERTPSGEWEITRLAP